MQQRILLVEDENMLRFAVKRMLEQDGYAVDTAIDYESAEQYIEANRKTPPDLVLTDFNYYGPNYDDTLGGWHTSKKVREVWGDDIACIVMTAQQQNPEHLKLFDNFFPEGSELGFHGVFKKPFLKDQLIEIVNAYIAIGAPSKPEPSSNNSQRGGPGIVG